MDLSSFQKSRAFHALQPGRSSLPPTSPPASGFRMLKPLSAFSCSCKYAGAQTTLTLLPHNTKTPPGPPAPCSHGRAPLPGCPEPREPLCARLCGALATTAASLLQNPAAIISATLPLLSATAARQGRSVLGEHFRPVEASCHGHPPCHEHRRQRGGERLLASGAREPGTASAALVSMSMCLHTLHDSSMCMCV